MATFPSHPMALWRAASLLLMSPGDTYLYCGSLNYTLQASTLGQCGPGSCQAHASCQIFVYGIFLYQIPVPIADADARPSGFLKDPEIPIISKLSKLDRVPGIHFRFQGSHTSYYLSPIVPSSFPNFEIFLVPVPGMERVLISMLGATPMRPERAVRVVTMATTRRAHRAMRQSYTRSQSTCRTIWLAAGPSSHTRPGNLGGTVGYRKPGCLTAKLWLRTMQTRSTR